MVKIVRYFYTIFLIVLLLPLSSFGKEKKEPDFISPPKKIKIAVFGDDYIGGYGMLKRFSYHATLERSIWAAGFTNVRVSNHWIEGAGSKKALAHINEVINEKPEIVILSFGISDLKNGNDIQGLYTNLKKMMEIFRENRIWVMLAGVNLEGDYPEEYKKKLAGMYSYLSKEFKVPLYPDILKDVQNNKNNLLFDKEHPNPIGVGIMVDNTEDYVKKMVEKVAARPAEQ